MANLLQSEVEVHKAGAESSKEVLPVNDEISRLAGAKSGRPGFGETTGKNRRLRRHSAVSVSFQGEESAEIQQRLLDLLGSGTLRCHLEQTLMHQGKSDYRYAQDLRERWPELGILLVNCHRPVDARGT